MRKLLTLLLLSPIVAIAQPPAPSAFHFKTKVAVKEAVEKVYFHYNDGEKNVVDSSLVVNEAFEFKGNIIEPTMATVRLKLVKQPTDDKQKWNNISFFLEPGAAMLITGDSAGHYRVKAGKGHEDYEKVMAGMQPHRAKLMKLSEAYTAAAKEKNQEEMDRLRSLMDVVNDEIKETVVRPFVENNGSSPVALFYLKQYAGWDIDPAKVEPMFTKLPEATRSLPSAVAFKGQIEAAKKTAVGVMAMEFSQADTSGMAVSLSSFRGKYVLVDFWASWCGPCRVENPNVVKAFNEYKDRGFTVLGVSLDRPNAKDKWLKAIYDDNLTWTHVSDLKYWDNEVAKQYGIRAIPQNFLIDPNGVIVGKNLTGKKLTDKLAELIK